MAQDPLACTYTIAVRLVNAFRVNSLSGHGGRPRSFECLNWQRYERWSEFEVAGALNHRHLA